MENIVTNLKEISKRLSISNINSNSNKDLFNDNVNKLKSIKKAFSYKFTNLIEIISKLELKEKVEEDEENPAAKKPQKIEWVTGKVARYRNGTYTETTPDELLKPFSVSVKFIALQNPASFTFGLCNQKFTEFPNYHYYNGTKEEGAWALAGSGVYGEDGVRKTDQKLYQVGDIMTIMVDLNSTVTYMINYEYNDYSYTMKNPDAPLYLAYSATSNVEIEILD